METKSYTIKKINNTTFFLFIKGDTTNKRKIYESISNTGIIPNAFYNDDEKMIFFTADSVIPLTTFLSKGKLTMLESINMVSNLSKQLLYLQRQNKAFYGFDLDDIIVINESKYIIGSAINMLDINNEFITFYSPINLPFFSSPELVEISKLPSKIHYSSSYYCLGALITFCLLNVNICKIDNTYNKENTYNKDNNYNLINDNVIDKILQSINYTKMYWFLKRCFLPKSQERVLLFI